MCLSFGVEAHELKTLKRNGRVTILKVMSDLETGEIVKLCARGETTEGRVVKLDGPYMFHFITLETP